MAALLVGFSFGKSLVRGQDRHQQARDWRQGIEGRLSR